MIRRLGAKAALAIALAFAFVGPLAARTQTWPQAHSDLKADPAIRFGVLPNGMRYALRKQATPPGQTALRLHIAAGSLMESDDEQGLAHFLEHMAFNGSARVKEGEMVRMLERLGLSFGADTNAYTSFSETVYKLDLPRSDAASLDTSLFLLREIASNLTIKPEAVDRERGVVLAEERARDSPAYRAQIQRMAFLMRGQRLPQRLPIGKAEILKSAPASRIAAFYARWYRPDRATLIAVGDFDMDAMEAKIRKDFADWAPKAAEPSEPDPGAVAARGAEAEVADQPGLQPSLLLTWVRPPQNRPDTVEERRRRFVDNIALAVLNRRLSRISRGDAPPFQGAGAFRSEQERAAELAGASVGLQPDRWREGLTAMEAELRRFQRFGVRQAELDREIDETRAALRAAAAGAATRRQADLAGEIVESLLEDSVVTSAMDDLANFEAAVSRLDVSAVNAAAGGMFEGQGPLVFLSSPTPVETAAVLAALDAARTSDVAAGASLAAAKWPYADFGPAGKIRSRRTVKDLGVTFVRFENGVRLTIKPTRFKDDEILLRVNVGDGMQSMRPDRQSPYWAASALIEGGLKRIDVEGIEEALAANLFGARFSVGDEAFVLSGSTRPADLPIQLQVLAAYLTDAAWREPAFQRLKTGAITALDQYETTPGGVEGRELAGLLRSGDRRWTFPSREELASADLASLKSVVAPALSSGRVEVVVVGAVEVEAAIRAAAATFGALPPRTPSEMSRRAAAPAIFPPANADPLRLTHKGRADQAEALIAWPTTDLWEDPQRARDVAVLREVMKLRLIDKFREAEGVTYSPDVSSQHSTAWRGWGYFAADMEAPPHVLDRFFKDVAQIAADLARETPSADELERAKRPRVETLKRMQQTNGYWLSELSGAVIDARRLKSIRQIVPGTEKVTARDVRDAARLRLRPDKAWKLVIVPQAAASP